METNQTNVNKRKKLPFSAPKCKILDCYGDELILSTSGMVAGPKATFTLKSGGSIITDYASTDSNSANFGYGDF